MALGPASRNHSPPMPDSPLNPGESPRTTAARVLSDLVGMAPAKESPPSQGPGPFRRRKGASMSTNSVPAPTKQSSHPYPDQVRAIGFSESLSRQFPDRPRPRAPQVPAATQPRGRGRGQVQARPPPHARVVISLLRSPFAGEDCSCHDCTVGRDSSRPAAARAEASAAPCDAAAVLHWRSGRRGAVVHGLGGGARDGGGDGLAAAPFAHGRRVRGAPLPPRRRAATAAAAAAPLGAADAQ